MTPEQATELIGAVNHIKDAFDVYTGTPVIQPVIGWQAGICVALGMIVFLLALRAVRGL